jgi:hypothetical protein
MLSILRNEASQDQALLLESHNCDPNSILFKHDRMYRHNVLRINYTTYDVRRSQDVVNPLTSHYNIMVLNNTGDDNDSPSVQPFRYARVLGTYHVNVVYVGPGVLTYRPRRMEFLWVRWYNSTGVLHNGWNTQTLDRIRFPSMAEDDAFGIIDPSVVIRSCHIIPTFAKGRRHDDGKGMSRLARDSGDWAEYYVNR